MIAYCLYKEQKRKYVEGLARRYKKISRRNRRVEDFHQDLVNDDQLANFRDAADRRLTTYVKKIVDQAKREARREIAIEKDYERLSEEAGTSSKTVSKWIFGVSTSIAATIIVGMFAGVDDYFSSVFSVSNDREQHAEAPLHFDTEHFRIEPGAPPKRLNLPVM